MHFIVWPIFCIFILGLIALDIGVFHKEDKEMSSKEALGWTVVWIVLALLFSIFIYYGYENHWLGLGLSVGHPIEGKEAFLSFLTGYVIEKSLSVDNLFVIAMIFSYFRIPLKYQHRVLFWGILGALVFRAIMISLGAFLVSQFSWVDYLFGALLLFTAVKMLVDRKETVDIEHYSIIRLIKKFYRVSTKLDCHHFFVIENGKKAITPLFMALVVVDVSDIFFAIDSIPAIFSITQDPFLVFTSNVFAILGLRSLYFAIAIWIGRLRYLKISLVFLLGFVGIKLLIGHHFPIPTWVSLTIIGGILSIGVMASLVAMRREAKNQTTTPEI